MKSKRELKTFLKDNRDWVINCKILQQYSSYSKDSGELNLILDGNLNATMHSIYNDFLNLKNTHSDEYDTITSNYSITIPSKGVNGISQIKALFAELSINLSDDNNKLNIHIDTLKSYGHSVYENRKNGSELFGEFFKKYSHDANVLVTNFENSFNDSGILKYVNEWKSKKESLGIVSRFNISRNSIHDDREFVTMCDSGVLLSAVVSDIVNLQNQNQKDYLTSTYPILNTDKIKCGNSGTKLDTLFNKDFLDIQLNGYSLFDDPDFYKTGDLFHNLLGLIKKVDYIFPFRISDPDWGYSEFMENYGKNSNVIVLNPTNVPINKTSLQIEFDDLTKDMCKRTLLFTIYKILSFNLVKTKIPLYSNPFNIMHQTTIELLYFCKDSILDANGIMKMSNFDKMLNNLFYPRD